MKLKFDSPEQKPKYFVIPINGYDAQTTVESIKKHTGVDHVEIMKSEDMKQVLQIPYFCGFEKNYAFIVTSDYECVDNPAGIWNKMHEGQPLMYNPDQKVWCINMHHDYCRSQFSSKTVFTPHIATFLDVNRSSAHVYRKSSELDAFFTKRGVEMERRRNSELYLTEDDAKKFKEAVQESKEEKKPTLIGKFPQLKKDQKPRKKG